MANAHGDWIVPAVDGISKRQLLERGNMLGFVYRTMWERIVMKLYGGDDMNQATEGLTWEEIASLIDDYIKA